MEWLTIFVSGWPVLCFGTTLNWDSNFVFGVNLFHMITLWIWLSSLLLLLLQWVPHQKLLFLFLLVCSIEMYNFNRIWHSLLNVYVHRQTIFNHFIVKFACMKSCKFMQIFKSFVCLSCRLCICTIHTIKLLYKFCVKGMYLLLFLQNEDVVVTERGT